MPEEPQVQCQIGLCDKNYFVAPAAQNSCVKNLRFKDYSHYLHSFFYKFSTHVANNSGQTDTSGWKCVPSAVSVSRVPSPSP